MLIFSLARKAHEDNLFVTVDNTKNPQYFISEKFFCHVYNSGCDGSNQSCDYHLTVISLSLAKCTCALKSVA